MAKYIAVGSQTLTTSRSTALSIAANATTAHRCRFYEFWWANLTPADAVTRHLVELITAVGTSTAVTPRPVDTADRAAQAQCGQNHTVEPTYTASSSRLDIPLNHRATMRWVAYPGSELVTPATASSGLALSALHATATSDWVAGAMW